ncbi:MAG TPA: DUF417 family protein [Streptosporangiaceae bacterium]
MGTQSTAGKRLLTAGIATARYGIMLNFLSIGRLKFEDYEVENIRPLITQHPLFSPLVAKIGERNMARLIGATEIVMGSMIATKPVAPKVSVLGSLAAVATFTTTLSFLATTPEAWQQKHGEPKLSPAGQFLIKDIVLLGASLLAAGDALQTAKS